MNATLSTTGNNSLSHVYKLSRGQVPKMSVNVSKPIFGVFPWCQSINKVIFFFSLNFSDKEILSNMCNQVGVRVGLTGYL